MKRFSYDRLEANTQREISAASVPPRKLVLVHSLITAGAVLLAASLLECTVAKDAAYYLRFGV